MIVAPYSGVRSLSVEFIWKHRRSLVAERDTPAGIPQVYLSKRLQTSSLPVVHPPIMPASLPDGKPGTIEIHGHRGARGLRPENTRAAFTTALSLGATALEMDVVIAGDGGVIVSHEPWFHAATCSFPDGRPIPRWQQRRYRIFEMTTAEVQRFDCGLRPHPKFPEQVPVPSYKPQLLEVVQQAEAVAAAQDRPKPLYSIEVKSRVRWEGRYHPGPRAFVQAVHRVLHAEGVVERSSILSFDYRILRAAREESSAWALNMLAGRFPRRSLERRLVALGFTPDIVGPDHRLVTPEVVQRAHAEGMRVVPWTVNAPNRMQALAAMGVDGITTDYPDRAVALFHRA